ncbi:MAG: TIGR04372 family glycosyltransferase [Verrucomicrobia bacterium]|nr:MAG: TIGR04372 family glycosyltransferase [Verrucomicrobiota bacterium]
MSKMKNNFLQKANKFKQEGKIAEAIDNYRIAIEQNPNFYWSHHNLGEALAELRVWDEAVASYHNAIKLNPNSAYSYYKMGESLAKLGKVKEVITAYIRAIEINPSFYVVYKKLGETFHQLAVQTNPEYFQECLFLYTQIEYLIPRFSDNYVSLTQIYDLKDDHFLQVTSQLNDEDFLEKAYGTYLRREPDEDGKAHYLQCLREGFIRQEIVTAFRQSPEFTSLLVFLITSVYLQEAIAAYHRTIELNPSFQQAHKSLGEALSLWGKALAQRGKLDEAIESYQQAISICHHNLAEVHYNKGSALSQQGHWDQAIESYQDASALQPDWVNVHLALGNAWLNQNQLAKAIDSYKRAISLRPESVDAHNGLGNAWSNQNQLAEAIDSYKRAISLQPEAPYAYFAVALALGKQDKLEEAIENHQKAIALQPNWIWPYFHLGTVLDELNRQDEAMACWEKMIALDPNNIDVYQAIAFHVYSQGKQEEWIKWIKISSQVQNDLARKEQLDKLGIRFLKHDWTSAIGHTALLDYYIKLGLLGWRLPHRIIVLATPQQVANCSYFHYWRSHIEVVSDRDKINSFSPKARLLEDKPTGLTILSNGEMLSYGEIATAVQKQWETDGKPPLLALSDSDHEEGWHCLESLGVPKGAWFVSLHVRTDGFHGHETSSLLQVRSANIDTYLLAIESIVAQGGWVIRMGDKTMKPLPPMSQVIDYVHSDQKSDRMDVFLCAACRFFIGTSSGLSFVPPTFGVPCVLTNWAPMGVTSFYSQDIFIPKLYWSELEQRHLTFQEFMSAPVNGLYHIKKLNRLGIQAIDNTPDEIRQVVLEILQQSDGDITYSQEDELLQQRFRTLARNSKSYGNSRIGRDFIQKYALLLPAKNQIKDDKDTNIFCFAKGLAQANEETERIAVDALAVRDEQLATIEREAVSSLDNALKLSEFTSALTGNHQQAEAINTQLGEANYYLGNTLKQQARLAEAKESYQKAITLHPNLAEAYYELGNILAEQGQLVEAIERYKTAITLNPELVRTDSQLIDLVYQLESQGHQFAAQGMFQEGFSKVYRALAFQMKLAEAKQLTKLGMRLLPFHWAGSIGHIALIDVYLKMEKLGWRPATRTVMLATPQQVINPSYLSYWNRYITIISDPLTVESLSPLARYLRELTGFYCCQGEWMYHGQAGGLVQKQWELENRPPLLSLSVSDYDRGWRCLQKLGLPKDAWFVSLHVREIREQGYATTRTADINAYLPAIKSIVERGGWVIRIGDRNMPPLPPMERVIDYAHSEVKSDWMDVFLLSQNRFFLGMPSGPYFVASTFGVDCVLTNWAQLIFRPWYGKSIFIPKLFWHETEKRYLTFAEIISQVGYIDQATHLNSMGINPVDNTAEEIQEIVLEMLERVDGSVKYTTEDECLQQQFNDIAEACRTYGAGKMGREFLRRNAALLKGEQSSL